MRRSMRVVGTVVGSVAAVTAGALAVGALVWNRATARAVARLDAEPARSGTGVAPTRFSPDELVGLPAPVVRYFEFALTPGQPLVRHARLTQQGTFAMRRDAWAPFTAVEDFAVWPPGFVWDARIRMAPGVVARVRDSYLAGEGVMQGKAAALVTVVDHRGTPEMAASSLLRYLAEAAWLPTALLPSAGVRWEAVDDSTARATLADAGTAVRMDVHFAASGEIARISADRHRDVNGTPVLTPWEGHFWDYQRASGMTVPMSSEVGWILSDGWFPYWRGRTVKAEYATVA